MKRDRKYVGLDEYRATTGGSVRQASWQELSRDLTVTRLAAGVTRWSRFGFLALALAVSAASPRGAPAPGPCDFFFEALSAVPHLSLTVSSERFTSVWDGEIHEGCEVEFETNDSIRSGIAAPHFFADPGTDLYGMGWRMRADIGADGAGSGVHGIEREAVLCVVRWEQPAYIDDDGELVVSDTMRIRVQCADGAHEQAPTSPKGSP